MLKELVDRLLSAGRDSMTPQKLHENHKHIQMLVPRGDGVAERVQYDKPRPVRNHTFATLTGFVDYLNGLYCDGAKGVVFIGRDGAYADLDYGACDKQRAVLRTDASSEYQAFQTLTAPCGVAQRDLFTLLNRELSGCVDAALMLEIRKIKLSAKAEQSVEIDVTGIESRGGSDVMTIQMGQPGQATTPTQMRVDWSWHGRIWECYDEEFTTPLRLQLSTADGLRFIFHAPGHARVVRDARQKMVEHLRDRLADAQRFEVYEGSY